MGSKPDIQKIQSYSLALAEKLTNQYFDAHATISGADILKFTKIEQVNIYVIKNLFDKWREESLKLRSPYFDYENSEVKEALKSLMNKLSRNILIRKEFFKPLLQQAISDTLMFTLVPYDFFFIEYLNSPVISHADLNEKSKYIKMNKIFLEYVQEKFYKENKPELPCKDIQQYLKDQGDIINKKLEDPNKIVSDFAILLKVSLDDFFESSEQSVEKQNTPKPSGSSIKVENPKKEEDDIATLNQLFNRGQQLTLNDTLKSKVEGANTASISDRHQKAKVKELKSVIPLNMKFLFINELFDSMSDQYNAALIEVESCEDFLSAEKVVREKYATKFSWDFNSNEVKEFMNLIQRRFDN